MKKLFFKVLCALGFHPQTRKDLHSGKDYTSSDGDTITVLKGLIFCHNCETKLGGYASVDLNLRVDGRKELPAKTD